MKKSVKVLISTLMLVSLVGVVSAAVYPRTAEILAPEEDEIVSGMVSFDAVLDDKDGDDGVQWAVRQDTCQASVGTVLGNVDGHNDPYDWDGADFHAEADVSSWDSGMYCFVFNPRESTGDTPIRLTREFYVSDAPEDINACKKGGWMTFEYPSFRNQGDCVSYVQSNENAYGNRKDNK